MMVSRKYFSWTGIASEAMMHLWQNNKKEFQKASKALIAWGFISNVYFHKISRYMAMWYPIYIGTVKTGTNPY